MANRHFELFVALRYLTAKRKQAVISVITAISVIGVAFGVMALVVALAINSGFRNTLQKNLIGATAQVMIMERETSEGIKDWRALVPKYRALRGVNQASASLYGNVIFNGSQPMGGTLKGILPPGEAAPPEALRKLRSGSFEDWKPDSRGRMPIIVGSRLAGQLGVTTGSTLKVITPQLSGFGQRLDEFPFRVTGIFESGFFEIDSAWAFTSLSSAQTVLGLPDVVNAIELQLDDVMEAARVSAEAEKIGSPKLTATNWREMNKPLLTALEGEKAVMVLVIGLIQGVAALNILTSLIMMVMEKHRDIALLMSMGARKEQISRIFILQGLLIGAAGTVLGLCGGYLVCYLGNRFRLIELNEAIYSLSYVPFEPKWIDGAEIAAGALLVSLIATIYPARNAARIAPAESLRYE